MKDTPLFGQLLGLKSPWSVKSIDLCITAIMVSAVACGMLRRTKKEMTHLEIDEKSSQKGHRYASILTDTDDLRVLGLVPERTLEADKSLLESLSQAQRASVKAVAMAMSPAYMSAVPACLPQADIVHHRFHIAKYLGDAVDAVSKQKHRCRSKEGILLLTGSKWSWPETYADGRSAEAVSFLSFNQLNFKTSRAWRIKETVTYFWSCGYQGAAKRFFVAWSSHAMRRQLEPKKKAATCLGSLSPVFWLTAVTEIAMPVRNDSIVRFSSSRPTPVDFATSSPTRQEFGFIVESGT